MNTNPWYWVFYSLKLIYLSIILSASCNGCFLRVCFLFVLFLENVFYLRKILQTIVTTNRKRLSELFLTGETLDLHYKKNLMIGYVYIRCICNFSPVSVDLILEVITITKEETSRFPIMAKIVEL